MRQLDAFRKKRNVSGYQAAGRISEMEAQEMATVAAKVRQLVEEGIRASHPELMP